MRHDPVTMRDWLASVPDDDLVSVIEVVPALQRASRIEQHILPGVRARIHEFSEQQVEGLARAFLAGVAQRLRTDGVPDQEIDEPDGEQLRSFLGQLPPAHGRLALHTLLIGTGPASSTARAHATDLMTALHDAAPKELPISMTDHHTTWDRVDIAGAVERLRRDTTELPAALRAAADAVESGSLPADAEPAAASLARFAAEMATLLEHMGALLGDRPAPSDLDGVQAHLELLAEQERLAAERALVREHRDGISATIARLESDGGPAFLVDSYRTMLAEIDRGLDAAQTSSGPAALSQPETPQVESPQVESPQVQSPQPETPQTAVEARALLAGIGLDDELLAVLRPWPQLCEPGEYISRNDVTAVVAAEPSAVPDLLKRLDLLGVLRENDGGRLALDEVTLRCLTLLPVE